MSSLIIPAAKSITITNKYPNISLNNVVLSVGNDGCYNYLSYLFFDISAVPCNAVIRSAELVLFKTDKFYSCDNKAFGIYGLNGYFSSFTNYNNYPEINHELKQEFFPFTTEPVVTVSILEFVEAWLKNSSINTSLMLYGKKKNSLLHFGSSKCTDKYLIPFLKVTFDCHCCNDYKDATLKRIQVTGTVAPDSIYNAVVNVDVKRHPSGHIDSYYIADQYDNSENNSSINIDKIYNLAIIPKESACDSETINFYGSYLG